MKPIIIAFIVLVIAGAGWYMYQLQSSREQGEVVVIASPSGISVASAMPASSSAPLVSASPVAHATVTYTGTVFSPKVLTVKKGTTVLFVNDSSSDMRVASNPHPSHTGYPTKGGCVSSTFDSCAPIGSGSSWQFLFTIPGSWGYHNHFNPSQGGTIVVE